MAEIATEHQTITLKENLNSMLPIEDKLNVFAIYHPNDFEILLKLKGILTDFNIKLENVDSEEYKSFDKKNITNVVLFFAQKILQYQIVI